MGKFFIKSFIILSVITGVLVTLVNKAHADEVCTIQCPVSGPGDAWAHYQDDHFRLTDSNQQAHMLVSLSGTLILGEVLNRYAGLKPWQSALIGMVTMTLVGVTKEVMFDAYNSKSDIKGWAIGAATGGVTFMVIHF